MKKVEERVKDYWTLRASDFGAVRRAELEDEISRRWVLEMEKALPAGKTLKILDVGTGAGYFAILLAEMGHKVCGVDLTPAMIEEAKKLAGDNEAIQFFVMDAQSLDFSDECFDAVISRNLTWTLPKPEQAYKEWIRVLKKGGILLNFDADYAYEVLKDRQDPSGIERDCSGMHLGMTETLQRESDEITLSMDISKNRRPDWDLNVLKRLGLNRCSCDRTAGERILKDRNGKEAPMFLITAIKEGDLHESV